MKSDDTPELVLLEDLGNHIGLTHAGPLREDGKNESGVRLVAIHGRHLDFGLDRRNHCKDKNNKN